MRCSRCGASIGLGEQYCGQCGAPRPWLPPRFEEVERAFVAWQALYQAGRLSDEAYETQLRKLVIEGADGGYWMLGAESGEWYWCDGREWSRRDPTSANLGMPGSASPQKGGQEPAGVRPLRPLRLVGAGMAAFLALGLCLAGAVAALKLGPSAAQQEGPLAVLPVPTQLADLEAPTWISGTVAPIETLATMAVPTLDLPVIGTFLPVPAATERVALYKDDFSEARPPIVTEDGEVKWEKGELRILATQSNRPCLAAFKSYVADDLRLRVTVRPIQFYPDSQFQVGFRIDPDATMASGYWVIVYGTSECRLCARQSDGSLDCLADALPCLVSLDGPNEVLISAIGPEVGFSLNGGAMLLLTDERYREGAVGFAAGNGNQSRNTLVAFDDLVVTKP